VLKIALLKIVRSVAHTTIKIKNAFQISSLSARLIVYLKSETIELTSKSSETINKPNRKKLLRRISRLFEKRRYRAAEKIL
jgi:hypothetical protein